MKCCVVALLSLLVTLLPTLKAARHDELITSTNSGRIRGVRYHLPQLNNKIVDAYLGIPFAKPPLKHLRFKHPQPIDKWSDVYNATKLPNSCYQGHDDELGDFRGSNVWNPNTPISEDCLYLNVWVPRGHHNKRPKRSAVMVWIFGGGFYSGTTTLRLYDGKVLAAESEIIVVSIAYRLGALGFLTLGDSNAPGNAGMFDQLMGLEWVQNNIRSFGGDPNNVTLFGESAGSVSASLHLLSPLSRSKFQRAILQSGTANMPWATLTQAEGKRRSMDLAMNFLGCNRSRSTRKIAECLRDKSADDIVREQWVARGIMQFPFVPVIDGSFIVEAPSVSLRNHNFKKCPILLGSNKNEGSWFLIYELPTFIQLGQVTMKYDQFLQSLQQLFTFYPQYPQEMSDLGRRSVIHQYTNWIDTTDQLANLGALDQAVSDFHYLCHVNDFGHRYAEARENVYSYYFTQRYSANPWPSWFGVLHGDEIFFSFGEPFKQGLNYTEQEKKLSRQMMRYWTNFAKTANPNTAPGRPSVNEWPLYSTKRREYLILNEKFVDYKKDSIAYGLRIKECAFWLEYLPDFVKETANISQAEAAWKREFVDWKQVYLADWKTQFANYQRHLRHQRHLLSRTCTSGGGCRDDGGGDEDNTLLPDGES